jgi:hypothetical protein
VIVSCDGSVSKVNLIAKPNNDGLRSQVHVWEGVVMSLVISNVGSSGGGLTPNLPTFIVRERERERVVG